MGSRRQNEAVIPIGSEGLPARKAVRPIRDLTAALVTAAPDGSVTRAFNDRRRVLRECECSSHSGHRNGTDRVFSRLFLVGLDLYKPSGGGQ
jgi:hypothetical protein